MARKRMIEPGLWTDGGFIDLCPRGRLLWIGLISHADDDGRGQGSAKSLKAAIFPSDEITIEDLEGLRREVAEHMRVLFYEVDGQIYYQLQKWKSYQSINKPSESSVPSPRGATVVLPERYRSATGGLREDYGSPTGALPPKERKKEEKERSARAREDPPPESSRAWVLSWYRAFTERTAQAVSPAEEQFALGAKTWKRAPPETLLASVPPYFDLDLWFTRPLRGSKRQWSFGNYCAHIEDVISATSANGSAKPQAKAVKVLRCPDGHPYLAEVGMCLECGWAPEPAEPQQEDDDGPDFG